jgi:site-specific DNA recombinase
VSSVAVRPVLRCAIYSRYSSDRQSPYSIEDQVRKCSEFAQRQGWEILDGHLYADRAISGVSADRDGLKRLMAAAATKAFDVALIDDSSRLSRNLSDALNLAGQLRFNGVRLIFVSQGIDSDSEQGEVLLATHGIVDSLYIRELGKKTHRGLEGKALHSLHTGGKVFGYRSVPIEDPERKDQYGRPLISGARLEINPDEAKTVLSIFRLYADGLSIKAVAKTLNAAAVRSPQPRAGRQQSWAPSSVRVILRNERYHGIVTWGRTRKMRNPANGRRISRRKPESEWIKIAVPEQQIVDDKLWTRVQGHLEYVNRVFGDRGRKGGLLRSRAASSRYIFSGLLKCGCCGSNFTIVSGAGKNHRAAEYGCPAHVGRGTCVNGRRVPSDILETELLGKLQRDVISPAAVDYVVLRLEEEVDKRFGRMDSDLAEMQRRKAVLGTELQNLQRMCAEGFDSPTIRAGITVREHEINELVTRGVGRRNNSVRPQVRNLRRFVESSMGDIRSLLAETHTNSALTRMALSKHLEEIILLPEGKGRTVKYRGQWKLLGSSDGAEGQS